ncbi:hypothetical protein G6F64_001909 [Rhizopus arrhizus]|uniref:Uncharacterized protein n=1 Tax=Rhizopus oryzae TaxID=64495 RepID=A0A9P6XI30_RHIOR|nr:hypothetical protein G6F64_001909 [Rhizopus arrhizus]
MPVSKTECPEILIKIATTIMVTETIEITGSNWLLMVLTHFERVRTVKIMLKGLSRKKVHDIWEIVNKVRTVENLVVPNTELRKWSKANQKKQPRINLRPLYLKNLKSDTIQIIEDYEPEQKEVIQKFNHYMSNATRKYESGYKPDNPNEALALSNIIMIAESNIYDVNQADWEKYIKKSSQTVELPTILSKEKTKIKNIIDKYSTNVLKDDKALFKTLFKYKAKESKAIKLCLETITNVDSVVNNTWKADIDTKEEDLFIKNFVDTMVIDPLFNSFTNDIKKHGNRHALKESRHRKVKQAKKNGDNMTGLRGRVPDRSLELKRTGNNVFICEVKTGSASTKHPDLTKLGTMLKDVLDYALEKGVTQKYATTGLLVEGVHCTVYSMTLPIPKLYHMTAVRGFDLPKNATELGMLKTIIESMVICQGLIDLSCRQLKAIGHQIRVENEKRTVPTCSSPPCYADYYK